MSEVNGKQLLAEGAVVDLGDGVERRVVFDLEAMLRIEERCGSLVDYLSGLSRGWNGRMLRSILVGLASGLHDDKSIDEPRIRVHLSAAMRDGWSGAQRFIDVLDQAWDDAMPSKSKDEAPAAGKDSAQASTSPGPSSTGEAQSTMAEATMNSGE